MVVKILRDAQCSFTSVGILYALGYTITDAVLTFRAMQLVEESLAASGAGEAALAAATASSDGSSRGQPTPWQYSIAMSAYSIAKVYLHPHCYVAATTRAEILTHSTHEPRRW